MELQFEETMDSIMLKDLTNFQALFGFDKKQLDKGYDKTDKTVFPPYWLLELRLNLITEEGGKEWLEAIDKYKKADSIIDLFYVVSGSFIAIGETTINLPSPTDFNYKIPLDFEQTVVDYQYAWEQQDRRKLVLALRNFYIIAMQRYVICEESGEFKPNLLDKLWNEVHSSNMTKACASEEVAQDTIRLLGEDFNNFTVVKGYDGKFYLHRNSDWKLIKSHQYREANIKDIIDGVV